MEATEEKQDRNVDEGGNSWTNKMGMRKGAGTKISAVAKMRTGTKMGTGTGTRTGFGGEAKKRKKSHKRCRRDEGNREHMNGKGK